MKTVATLYSDHFIINIIKGSPYGYHVEVLLQDAGIIRCFCTTFDEAVDEMYAQFKIYEPQNGDAV